MAAQTDFWGELGIGQIKSPVSILREQAALLGKKTKNLVEARVETNTFHGEFIHAFNIVVPALDYAYELFTIQHGVNIYPIAVPFQSRTLANEEEFQRWLQERLSSPETKKVISNLLAQVE